ncbi:MAG: DEAD/DEAH box helicase [Candidatus Micrarchaeia archaeon]
MSVFLSSYTPIEKTEILPEVEYEEIELNKIVRDVFNSKGIKKLYKHQAEAINFIRNGKNIVVNSPTASGKSEIYISEIINAALNKKNSLILYPTKALSRDQLRKFSPFLIYGIDAKIYDGDTPEYQRKRIRENNPRILITNVDMLHFILMNNRSFKNFFNNLKFVVLDETHYYSGLLGSHVHNLFWRLKRLCPKKPQFIMTSATIQNAKEFSSKLIGEDVKEITGISTKHSKIKHYMIPCEEKSYFTTILEILKGLKDKTLIFGNSHLVVERLSLYAKTENIPLQVYRSGLAYEKRKGIEEDFRKGKINYLATTSALELGLDIGDVDCVILAGFPGTITRVKQRIGRAGRFGQDATSIFVSRENPIDQYYIDNPIEYLKGSPERCYVNPENKKIKKIHILCASKDKLLKCEELEQNHRLVEELENEGLLKKWNDFYSMTPKAVSIVNSLNLRGIGHNITIKDADTYKFLGEREYSIALSELYEGAIYLHGGIPYLVEKLDLEKKEARISKLRGETNEFTQALKTKEIQIIEKIKESEITGFPIFFGKIHIKNQIYGYRIKDIFSGRILSEEKFKIPYEYEFDSYSFWIDLNSLSFDVENFSSGLHAFEHITIGLAPALLGCESKEIGGLSYPSGEIFIFESAEGGNGISELIFENFNQICSMSFDRLNKCRCENGCPKCILNSSCGNDNQFLNKNSAKEILKSILGVK